MLKQVLYNKLGSVRVLSFATLVFGTRMSEMLFMNS